MNRFAFTLFVLQCTFTLAPAQVVRYGVMGGGSTAQKPPKMIDTAFLQVNYKVLSIVDSLAPEKIAEDNMILQIGKNRTSKFFTDTRVRDSIMRATIERANASGAGSVTIQSQQMRGGTAGSGDQSVVFKNYPAGSVTVTDRVMMDAYVYTEPANEILWQILPETDTIMSYACQKAIATFRGRSYEAWFSPDIPVNEGPWKFGGLPGLILKIADSRRHYVFECTSLEHTSVLIEYPDTDYLKTNRRDMARVKRKYIEDPVAAMEGMRASAPAGANVMMMVRSADGTATSDMNEIRERMRNRAYNPIELDY